MRGAIEATTFIDIFSNKDGYVSRILVTAPRGTVGARCLGFACKRIMYVLGLSAEEYMYLYKQSYYNPYVSVWCNSLNRRIHMKRTVSKELFTYEFFATDI